MDQAARLRKLIRTADDAPREVAARLPMVVVSGARTGVGATTVAVNLAAVLADRGERVLLVDAAENGSALADALGIGREIEYSVADVMSGKCGVADAMVSGPVGMKVLANRQPILPRREREFRRNSPTVGDQSRLAQQRLLAGLESLKAEIDLIVVDAGCGMTPWTQRFWLRSQLVVLVTTTDDSAIMDAYAAMKLSSTEGIRPAVRLLINRSESNAVAEDAHRRMQSACRRFLSLSVEALQPLSLHTEAAAGGSSEPRVWESPNSPFGHAALWLGRAVSDVLSARIEDGGCGGQGGSANSRPLHSASCIL